MASTDGILNYANKIGSELDTAYIHEHVIRKLQVEQVVQKFGVACRGITPVAYKDLTTRALLTRAHAVTSSSVTWHNARDGDEPSENTLILIVDRFRSAGIRLENSSLVPFLAGIGALGRSIPLV